MASQATHTRFMVLSDTHNFEIDTHKDCPLSETLPKVDVALHCGDLTQAGGLSAYKKALKMFKHLDAELKLVIAGNHDLSLDGKYWSTHLEDDDDLDEHDQAVEIPTGPLAKEANVTYLTEGIHTFTLNNGSAFSIFVSPYQPEFGDWAFGYPRGARRWDIPGDVDIVMTHGPAHGILDYAHGQNLGCETLLDAVAHARPLMHCFGHIHEGYGYTLQRWSCNDPNNKPLTATVARAGCAATLTEREQVKFVPGHDTLMVNAAIMDGSHQPRNAPWTVGLPLNK